MTAQKQPDNARAGFKCSQCGNMFSGGEGSSRCPVCGNQCSPQTCQPLEASDEGY